MELFVKARELGEAIAASEVFNTLKQTEQRMNESAQAKRITEEYDHARAALQALMERPQLDRDAVSNAARALEALEAEMNDCEVITQYKEAQQVYAQVLDQVNAILRHHVGASGEGGCGGGHGHRHGEGGCGGGGCSGCGGH